MIKLWTARIVVIVYSRFRPKEQRYLGAFLVGVGVIWLARSPKLKQVLVCSSFRWSHQGSEWITMRLIYFTLWLILNTTIMCVIELKREFEKMFLFLFLFFLLIWKDLFNNISTNILLKRPNSIHKVKFLKFCE